MTQKTNFFKLGLFVILAFALTAAMLIAFGAGKFLKTEILAETYFNETVQGLDIGSEVKYKGVKIGTVKSITTPTKVYGIPSNYVLVTFSLAEDCYVGQTGKDAGERMKKAIDEGLSISLSFKGLTGAAYLETDYQVPANPLEITWNPKNLYVPSRRSNIKRVSDALKQMMDSFTDLDIQNLGKDIGALVKNLNNKANDLDMAQISNQAGKLLKELRKTNEKIAGFIESNQMKQIVADAGTSMADLKLIVQDAKEPVKNTLADVETAAAGVTRMTNRLESDYGPKIARLTQKMEATLASLEKTSKMLENMVWVNADIIGKTIENFEHTAENLNQLTLELRKYPGRILMEAPPESQTPAAMKENSK